MEREDNGIIFEMWHAFHHGEYRGSSLRFFACNAARKLFFGKLGHLPFPGEYFSCVQKQSVLFSLQATVCRSFIPWPFQLYHTCIEKYGIQACGLIPVEGEDHRYRLEIGDARWNRCEIRHSRNSMNSCCL